MHKGQLSLLRYKWFIHIIHMSTKSASRLFSHRCGSRSLHSVGVGRLHPAATAPVPRYLLHAVPSQLPATRHEKGKGIQI